MTTSCCAGSTYHCDVERLLNRSPYFGGIKLALLILKWQTGEWAVEAPRPRKQSFCTTHGLVNHCRTWSCTCTTTKSVTPVPLSLTPLPCTYVYIMLTRVHTILAQYDSSHELCMDSHLLLQFLCCNGCIQRLGMGDHWMVVHTCREETMETSPTS